MTEPASTASAELSPEVAKIRDGYTFEEPAIELGVVMENDTPVPEAVVRIPLSMLNRHGLVAGATGTGKTKTLQLNSQGTSCWRGPGRSVRTGSRGPVRSSSSLWVAGAWESRSARR
jgi:hypothetical protein